MKSSYCMRSGCCNPSLIASAFCTLHHEHGDSANESLDLQLMKQLNLPFNADPFYVETSQYHPQFVTKDTGTKAEMANGMVRNATDGKTKWHLIFDGPLLKRYAELLTRGANIYGDRNWTKAFSAPHGPERDATRDRFKESAIRHFFQWAMGETDEDHICAVWFNAQGYEAMKNEPK